MITSADITDMVDVYARHSDMMRRRPSNARLHGLKAFAVAAAYHGERWAEALLDWAPMQAEFDRVSAGRGWGVCDCVGYPDCAQERLAIEQCCDCGMTDGSCACAPAGCPECGAIERCDCWKRDEPHCAGGCSDCLGLRGAL